MRQPVSQRRNQASFVQWALGLCVYTDRGEM